MAKTDLVGAANEGGLHEALQQHYYQHWLAHLGLQQAWIWSNTPGDCVKAAWTAGKITTTTSALGGVEA